MDATIAPREWLGLDQKTWLVEIDLKQHDSEFLHNQSTCTELTKMVKSHELQEGITSYRMQITTSTAGSKTTGGIFLLQSVFASFRLDSFWTVRCCGTQVAHGVPELNTKRYQHVLANWWRDMMKHDEAR